MLIYPKYPIKTRKNKNQTEVWDIIRKRWITLTPEEMVRQHLIHYLIQEKKYPAETIAVEKTFEVFNTKKRFDVAVLNKQQTFVLIAECKAPHIVLNEKTIQQILTYNLKLNAQCLVITNGLQQYVFEKEREIWVQKNDIKEWCL